MSALVNRLRARPTVLSLGGDAADAITVRVQMPELWDTIAVRVAPDASVQALKKLALDAFHQDQHPTEEFVMKLRGFLVTDENAPLSVAGARDGSTFLLSYRYRRPVR